MRKGLVSGLIGVGAFLVVIAILSLTYWPGQLLRTPLDVDTTTRLEGTAVISGEESPIKATNITRVDSEKSDDDVVVFRNSTCVVRNIGDVADCVSQDDPENRLVTASEGGFAADRRTGMAVNKSKYVSADAGELEGLVNKFPFETEKKDYPYWEDTTEQAVDAVYQKSVTIRGLETYLFTVDVEPTPVEIAAGVDGLYSTTKELYVEPLTGSIIRQVEQQVRTTADGEPVAEINLDFTDAQVKTNVDDANSNRRLLNLALKVVPLVGLIAGIPILLAGLVLLVLGRRGQGASNDASPKRADEHV